MLKSVAKGENMFCVKCGKQTNDPDGLCEDCKAAKNAAEQSDADKPNTGMLSFGKALASTIMGFGVFIVSSVLNSEGLYMNLIAMIFMLVIDIAATALAIFFGAKGIHAYSTFKLGAGKKPVPAFVLGIVGVILAGISTVIIVVFLFVGLPEIALLY